MDTATLNGRWAYRSFRHAPIVIVDGQVDGTPELALPWSPPGVLQATTDAEGRVTGTLTFGPGIALKVDGQVHPATDKMPPSVELIGAGMTSVNRIKGYFVPDSDHVVGTIERIENRRLLIVEILEQPHGAHGKGIGGGHEVHEGHRRLRLTGRTPRQEILPRIAPDAVADEGKRSLRGGRFTVEDAIGDVEARHFGDIVLGSAADTSNFRL